MCNLDIEKTREVIRCYSNVSELDEGIEPLEDKLNNLTSSYLRHKKIVKKCVDELYELCVKINSREEKDCIIKSGQYTLISVVPHDIMKKKVSRPKILNNQFIISGSLGAETVYLLISETCIALEILLKIKVHQMVKSQCKDKNIEYNYDEVALVLKSARSNKAKEIKEKYKDTSIYSINNSSHSLSNIAKVLVESNYESINIHEERLGELIPILDNIDSDKLMEQIRYGEKIEKSTWEHILNMILFLELH